MKLGKQVRVADPTFLGYFIDKGAASAAKVVRKVSKITHFMWSIIFLDDANVACMIITGIPSRTGWSIC